MQLRSGRNVPGRRDSSTDEDRDPVNPVPEGQQEVPLSAELESSTGDRFVTARQEDMQPSVSTVNERIVVDVASGSQIASRGNESREQQPRTNQRQEEQQVRIDAVSTRTQSLEDRLRRTQELNRNLLSQQENGIRNPLQEIQIPTEQETTQVRNENNRTQNHWNQENIPPRTAFSVLPEQTGTQQTGTQTSNPPNPYYQCEKFIMSVV